MILFNTRNEEGKFEFDNVVIDDLHICTESDLEKFYPVKKSSKDRYESIKPTLMCFDHSKVDISLGLNSLTG